MEKIKGYKGFDKDMKCRGFQYEEGKDYTHEGDVKCCKGGFHFCENPFDVFSYYDPANSRYCEVEGSGKCDKDDDTKVSVSNLHVGLEIGLNGLINAGVKFIFDKVKWEDCKSTNTGNYSAATNTGNYSAATNTGNYSAATNTGYRSAATNTGYRSAATNTGDRSAATNTGDRSAVTNTGDLSTATNTGYSSAATNTGNRSAATNTGDYSAATNTGNHSASNVEGQNSIAIVTGRKSRAAGALGCWLVLTERDDNMNIINVKAIKVDGKKIKANIFYTLEDGEIKEAEQQ